jgi:outer membrane protein OmpA-like peptidoglycan-associated protein
MVTVALLADDSGAVGRAQVSNAAGAVELTGERQATRVGGGTAPAAPTVLDPAAVQNLFGEALAVLPLPAERLVMRFQLDSDELADESRALLPTVLRLVRERPAVEVTVVGHTDTTGTPDANLALGLRRAEAVRRLLVEAGLDAAAVETRSHGESDPAIATPDDTAEPANRRVEITLR